MLSPKEQMCTLVHLAQSTPCICQDTMSTFSTCRMLHNVPRRRIWMSYVTCSIIHTLSKRQQGVCIWGKPLLILACEILRRTNVNYHTLARKHAETDWQRPPLEYSIIYSRLHLEEGIPAHPYPNKTSVLEWRAYKTSVFENSSSGFWQSSWESATQQLTLAWDL